MLCPVGAVEGEGPRSRELAQANRLDPERRERLLIRLLKMMIDAVQRYDGYVVQSTGDDIFAFFGAPGWPRGLMGHRLLSDPDLRFGRLGSGRCERRTRQCGTSLAAEF